MTVKLSLKSEEILSAANFSLALDSAIAEVSVIDKFIGKGLVDSLSWGNWVKVSIVKILILFVHDASAFVIAVKIPLAKVVKVFSFML